MNSAATITFPGALSEGQKQALLKLLADDDPQVFATVRERILSLGPDNAEWLRAYALSDDPLLRRRTRAILLHFSRQEADNRFLAFCLKNGQEFDLEDAAWLLARTRYPEINEEGYRALLDSFAQAMEVKSKGADSKETLVLLNHYLFDELEFAGNEENYYDPENSYFNRVIDRRTGNPINLSLLYLVLARRLRLPVTGIGLPGHFICRFQTTSSELYVDPFNRGKLLTKADCVQYLLQGNYSLRDDYLAPVTPRRILLRVCGNLHQIYLHLEQMEEATRVQRYLVALSK